MSDVKRSARRSLRVRLTALVAGVFAVTLIVAGLAARSQFRSTLEDNARQNGLVLLDDFIAPSPSGLPVIDETDVTRLDEARGRRDGGAGLGLAIVHEVAVHHGAELRIADNPPGGARFEIVCPSA